MYAATTSGAGQIIISASRQSQKKSMTPTAMSISPCSMISGIVFVRNCCI